MRKKFSPFGAPTVGAPWHGTLAQWAKPALPQHFTQDPPIKNSGYAHATGESGRVKFSIPTGANSLLETPIGLATSNGASLTSPTGMFGDRGHVGMHNVLRYPIIPMVFGDSGCLSPGTIATAPALSP